jgi:hypothetical protein
MFDGMGHPSFSLAIGQALSGTCLLVSFYEDDMLPAFPSNISWYFLVRSTHFLCCILVFQYNPSEGSFVMRLGFNVNFLNV